MLVEGGALCVSTVTPPDSLIQLCDNRGVAQPGRAPRWGCGCRRFESSRRDHHTLLSLNCSRSIPFGSFSFAVGVFSFHIKVRTSSRVWSIGRFFIYEKAELDCYDFLM
jgi:hypothetical protein